MAAEPYRRLGVKPDVMPQFNDTALERMYTLSKDGKFTDFEINVEGSVLKVHRIILASSSVVFQRLVSIRKEYTNLKGLKLIGMEPLIKYAYTGILELTLENIGDVMDGAQYLHMTKAFDHCVMFIQDSMTFDNANELMAVVKRFDNTLLNEYHRNLHLKNFPSFLESQAFLEIDADSLAEYLLDDGLVTTSESILLHHCLRWLNYNIDKRTDVAHKVFENVRLSLDGWPLIDFAEAQSIYKTDKRCQDVLQYYIGYMENSIKRYVNNTIYKLPIRSPRYTIVQFGGLRTCDHNDEALMNGPANIPCGWSMNHYFHPDRKSWFPLGAVGNRLQRISHQQFVEMNGCGILVGGLEYNIINDTIPSTCLNDVKMFHAQGHFEICKMSSLRHQRAGHAAVHLDGYIYAIAGYDDKKTLKSMERFDCYKETWSYARAIPQNVYNHAAVACQGKIYVSGGIMSLYQKPTKLVWRYDPQINNWMKKQSMLCARAGHGMVGLNGRLYVAGGCSLKLNGIFDCLPDVECYTINTNQWTMLSPLHQGIANFEMKVLEGKIIIMGGMQGSTILDDMYEYNEALDQWNTFAKLPCPLKNTCCGIVALTLTDTGCMDDETDVIAEEYKRKYNITVYPKTR